jgi:hypothetical protein
MVQRKQPSCPPLDLAAMAARAREFAAYSLEASRICDVERLTTHAEFFWDRAKAWDRFARNTERDGRVIAESIALIEQAESLLRRLNGSG